MRGAVLTLVFALSACAGETTEPLPVECRDGIVESIDLPSTTTREECEAAGGWVIGDHVKRVCACPTNDAGKACTTLSECEGGCVVQTRDREICRTATVGACHVLTYNNDCICTIGTSSIAGGGNLVLCTD